MKNLSGIPFRNTNMKRDNFILVYGLAYNKVRPKFCQKRGHDNGSTDIKKSLRESVKTVME